VLTRSFFLMLGGLHSFAADGPTIVPDETWKAIVYEKDVVPGRCAPLGHPWRMFRIKRGMQVVSRSGTKTEMAQPAPFDVPGGLRY
jgi:hypothetical protein